MNKKIGLFWLRDDFRINKNDGLIEATRNHDQVIVFYLYKEEAYKQYLESNDYLYTSIRTSEVINWYCFTNNDKKVVFGYYQENKLVTYIIYDKDENKMPYKSK